MNSVAESDRKCAPLHPTPSAGEKLASISDPDLDRVAPWQLFKKGGKETFAADAEGRELKYKSGPLDGCSFVSQERIQDANFRIPEVTIWTGIPGSFGLKQNAPNAGRPRTQHLHARLVGLMKWTAGPSSLSARPLFQFTYFLLRVSSTCHAIGLPKIHSDESR